MSAELAHVFAGKRLLIFDLDGTLVDSSPLHARAFGEAFAPLGLKVDYETIAGMTTVSAVDQLLARAGLNADQEQRDQLRSSKQAAAARLIEEELEALPGAVEFVALARRLFACALCTSASPPSVEVALGRVGMSDWFHPVVTAADVKRGKPDPQAFQLVLEKAGIGSGEALVFEDSESGLAAARAAGIDAVHIAPHKPDWVALRQALEAAP